MSALLLTVILVVAVTALLLGYFYLVQRKHYDVAMAALGKVDEIRVRETASFVTLPAAADAGSDGAEASHATTAKPRPPQPLTIEGTKTVAVGRQSTPFTVVDALPVGSQVAWRVEPQSAAGLAPSGASVALVPAVVGTLSLHASVSDANGTVTHQGSFATNAVEARTTTLELPWVGQGVGTLVVSVMIVGTVLYLANEGVIDGAVVAAIVTALAGFVYGSRAAASR